MRTRTISEIEQIPVRLPNGRVRMGRQTQHTRVPALPLDWDRIILNAATTVAVAVLAVSVAWTAASVGGLLALAAPRAIAYSAAGGFDLVWIACLGLEYVARHDPDRADGPHRAGIAFLVVSMAAVGVHGWQTGNHAVGIVGAGVSAIAKALWAVVLKYRSVQLPEPVQDVLAQERAELGLELALAAHQRQALRTRAQLKAYRAALGLEEEPTEPVPARRTTASGHAEATLRAAVRAARTALPTADPAALVAQLAHAGITVDEATVRGVIDTERAGDAAGAHHDAPQVNGISQTAAIEEAAALLGSDASAARVVGLVQRRHGLVVEENYVRTVLSRARRRRGGAPIPAREEGSPTRLFSGAGKKGNRPVQGQGGYL